MGRIEKHSSAIWILCRTQCIAEQKVSEQTGKVATAEMVTTEVGTAEMVMAEVGVQRWR